VRARLPCNRIRGLYGIIDTSLVPPGRAAEAAGQLLESGLTILQLRAKGLPSGEFLLLARRLKHMASGRGALFIVNDRVDIAAASEADGVHLGQSDIPVEEARRLMGHDKLIGLSTHSLTEAKRAGGTTADYVSFGPVFPTSTKEKADPPLGLEALKEARALVKKPLVAIGGIKAENLPGVLACGVDAVAVISHILKSGKPGDRAKGIISIINASQGPAEGAKPRS